MKKLLMSLSAAVMGILGVNAQGMPEIPADSALRVGRLDNGLTYYIRHNETPKGQADFFIAQNVGSILENDSQRGLAHFLEHMCFNGTVNFPGNKVIDWLATKGVRFGQNLNAYTGVDETVYNISSVPVADKAVVDSCLLILHDWADGLLLDPKEIDSERGVIHEEWRMRMVGTMRLYEQLLPTIYPDNKYGVRLPIGTMEVVDNFPPQALRDYYEEWYRPDNQAIIVVGDIDPDYIEAQIKAIFGPIKMPENPQPREFVQVQDTPGTIYAIGKDKEQTASTIMFMFKQKEQLLPKQMRGTFVYYPVTYLTEAITTMLNHRLADIAATPDATFAYANVEIGDFFLSKTKDALTLYVIAKGNDICKAFGDAYRELLRAVRGGFTVSEYDRARTEILSQYEKQYDQRGARENTSYCREYAQNFTTGDPIPGIEFEYKTMQMIAQMITLEQINSLLPEMYGNDNRVLMGMFPDNDNVIVPTEAQLAEVIDSVEAENIEPFKEELKSEPLIPNLPKAVKPTKVAHNDAWDATEITYANGVRVIVKPTKFKESEIAFDAIATGGLANYKPEAANEIIFMPYALGQYSLGTYTDKDLKKYLSGKQTNINLGFDTYNREIGGKTTTKNLPTLMEMVYATFTSFDIQPEEFAAQQSKFEGMLANQEKDPQYIFGRDIMKTLFGAAAKQAISTEAIRKANRETTVDIVRAMLASPKDYTFVFVGDIDMDAFTQLANQYLGTLPTNGKSIEYAPVEGFNAAQGTKTKEFTTAMTTPQTWAFIGICTKQAYTAKNKVLMSMSSQILTSRLLRKVREEMGATYSISAQGILSRQGSTNTVMQIAWPMKPELRDSVLTEVRNILEGLSKEVSDEDITTVREYLVKNANDDLEKNDSWASAIAATMLNDVDTWNGYVDVVNAISADDIKAYVRGLLDANSYITILLDAEKAEKAAE